MMKIFAALMVLIAFSAGAKACWVPPTNAVDNSTHEVEPVKVVEPVEGTTTEEGSDDSGADDESNDESDSSTDNNIEVVAPVADTTVTEEPEVVETPVTEAETQTEVEVARSSGYGEAHVVEITTTTETVQEQDTVSHPVVNGTVIVTSIGSNSAIEQNDDSNVTAVNTGSNNGSYTSVGIALILAVLIAVAIYYIRK